jgi:hypothetical protein
MASLAANVGNYFTGTLCTLSANFTVDLTVSIDGYVPYTSTVYVVPMFELIWNKATKSGTLVCNPVGPATMAGTFVITATYRGNGQTLGTSTHSVIISPAYQPAAPAPAPAPAPSPPGPIAPPVPAPVPQPGIAPDPYFSQVKALLHFDASTGLFADVKGNSFSATGAVSSTLGAVYEGLYIPSGASIQAQINDIDAPAITDFTVECLVSIDQSSWDALSAPGNDERYCPVVSCISPQNKTIWMVGLMRFASMVSVMYWHSASIDPLPRSSAGSFSTFPVPGAFIQIIYSGYSTTRRYGAAWINGQAAPAYGFGGNDDAAPGSYLRIGGIVPVINYLATTKDATLVPFSGVVDEVRVTKACRYASYLTNPPSDIPVVSRLVPWPNN